MSQRQIIQIDEDKCNGCGECILTCAEGALEIVDGKAKLVGELLCDGLGACLGECPTGALTVVERDADEFDPQAVDQRLKKLGRELPHGHDHSRPNAMQAHAHDHAHGHHGPGGGCPSASALVFDRKKAGGDVGELESELGHWPVKLQLLGPGAPFLRGADLLLTADCVPFAFPDFHRKLLRGNAVAIGCPKLDDIEAHVERLADIIKHSQLKSLSVVHMEVPCCFGFMHAAQEAVSRAGVAVPLKEIIVGRSGQVVEEKAVAAPRSREAGAAAR